MNSRTVQALLSAGLAACAVVAQVLPAKAFTGYTDRSAWETAIGSFDTEDFNEGGSNGLTNFVDFEGFAVDSVDGSNKVGVANGGFLRVRAKDQGLEFVFEEAIKGFFADWGTLGGGVNEVGPQTVLSGNFDGTGVQEINLAAQLPNEPGRSRKGSFGIVSEDAFSSFFLKRTSTGGSDNISIENFSYRFAHDTSPIESVPEPTTALALLSVGAITAAGARKRKKQAA